MFESKTLRIGRIDFCGATITAAYIRLQVVQPGIHITDMAATDEQHIITAVGLGILP